MNENFYLGLANELAAKLRRVSSFVNHGPSIGSYHEEVLKTILSSMLPERFTLKTGFSYTTEQGPSSQGDILIIDENNPAAYFFKEGNFAVAHPDAVVCAIEVKTKLNKQTFGESIKNLHSFSVRSINKRTTTFLFSYDSVPFTPKTLARWYASISDIPDEPEFYPWAIYALNQGIILMKSGKADNICGHVACTGEETEDVKLKSLSIFLQTIRKKLLLHSQIDLNPFGDAAMDGMKWSDVCYTYG